MEEEKQNSEELKQEKQEPSLQEKQTAVAMPGVIVNKSRSNFVLTAVGFLVLLLLFGGGAWAYYAGFIPSFLKTPSSVVMARMFDRMSDINTFSYNLDFDFKSEKRTLQTQSPAKLYDLIPGDNRSADKIYQSLPSDIEAKIKTTGSAILDSNIGGEITSTASGRLSLGTIKFDLGADIVKKNGELYAKINTGPSLGILDLSKIKGQWIKFSVKDLGFFWQNYGNQIAGLDVQKSKTFRRNLLTIIKQQNLVSVSEELPKEKDKYGTYYRYRIKVDYSKLGDFCERVNNQAKQDFGIQQDLYSKETISYFRSPEFLELGDWWDKNGRMDIWIDSKNYWLRKISSESTFIPPVAAKKLNDRQYRSTVVLELADHNKPVHIDEPNESISWSEAQLVIFRQAVQR